LFYGEKVPRTTGIGLMENLLALAEAKGFGVFLFGARPESNRIAAEAILKRYPKLRLSGRRDGYVPAEEYLRLIEEINGSGAEILFVALGSPFQEKWITRFRKDLAVKVCMGVGGSLDVMSGAVPAAPAFWRAVGLEWLYRLIREPSRARRQTALPAFILASLRERLLSGDKR
jgi:N-acetylglucosaminyldiphosphoundecaprenol N-acetyl-beta-D-mannosaminyltransferase